MSELTLFNYTFEPFKIDKPIRLIELFAGIGSQAKALERLGADFEHYRVCEFDKYAVKSYNAIHGTNFETSDITKITADDLGIVDTDKYCYIITYSFPCQDLSVAGKQKGYNRDSRTRSGLLWEVERLLDECQELPQVLLMENVPQVHSEGDNFNNFRDWINKLDSLGYNSYFQDLNAKNYGVPQNRNRCFMVSLLGEYDYEFPKPFPLKLRMKDLLDSKVDEKYYLSDTMVDYILDVKNTQQGSEWEGRADSGAINKDVALTLGCRSAGGHQIACVSNFVLDGFDQEVSVKDLKNSRSQFVNVEREREREQISKTVRSSGRGSTDRHSWDIVVELREDG